MRRNDVPDSMSVGDTPFDMPAVGEMLTLFSVPARCFKLVVEQQEVGGSMFDLSLK